MLAVVGGEQRRGAAPSQPLGVLRAQRERVGVDQHRDVLGQDGFDRGRGDVVGAQARADDPGLHPTVVDDGAAAALADHRLRPAGADLVRRVRRPGEADHPDAGAQGGPDRENRRPGVGLRAGRHTHHTPAVLVRAGTRARQQACDVGSLEHLHDRVGQVQADVDEVDGAGVDPALAHQQTRLEGAQGDGQVGVHRRSPHRAGVGVDAARQVHRDDVVRPRQLSQRCGRWAQRPAPADPDHPVEHQVGRVEPADATARGEQRGQTVGPGPPEQHGRDARTPRGQPRTGPQRVGAVVAGTDQQHDPSAVAPTEPAGTRHRQTGRRPLHERTGGKPLHELGLGGPDLRHRVGRPHGRLTPALTDPRPRRRRSRRRRRGTATGARW